jgi:hypothetical protein
MHKKNGKLLCFCLTLSSHIRLQLVPKSSATIPNAEAIALNKDHIGIAKFQNHDDSDLKVICEHLHNMVLVAPQKIARQWEKNGRLIDITLLSEIELAITQQLCYTTMHLNPAQCLQDVKFI